MRNFARTIRSLIGQPHYTALAVLTLAVGIGVQSAMFGLLDAVYFRPLPITDPEQLVELTLVSPGNRFSTLSYQEFRDVERSVSVFKDVMAIGRRGVTLNHNGEAQLLLINYVSGRYFPSLGIPMHLGRGFTFDDDRPNATTPQVVINHHLWRERLGSPPDIIGRTIQLNSTHFTVIGVTAPGFVGLERIIRTDVWVTAAQAPLVVRGLRDELEDRRRRWFSVTARLNDGVDAPQVAQALDSLLARWRTGEAGTASDYRDARLVARRQRDATRQATMQGAVLLSLVGLVLLIACANVANLTLARGEGRRRERSIRVALGATRIDLMRQMLLESGIVSTAAAAVGLLIASWLIALVPAWLPQAASSIMLDVRVDGRLLGFAMLLAAMTTAVVGLVPAWRGTRGDIAGGLKARSATTTQSGAGLQLRDVLVIGEIALSGVVVIAAALLLRAFAQTLDLNPGFDRAKNVATFYLVPGLNGYDRAATYRVLEDCRRAASTVAGVKRVSYGIRLPTQGNEAGWSSSVVIPGKEPPPGTEAFDVRYTMVGPGYFEVMGTRILSGRGIAETDSANGAPVAVISATMARRFWPGDSALGRRIRMGARLPVDREIVGVAEDIRISGLYEAPEMYIYVPYAQDAQNFGLLLVEAQVDPTAIVPAVKRRIADIDPALPILRVSSVAEHMSLLLYEDRRNASVAFAIALLALALSAVGVYGVVSLLAARRTKEIGIRVALGARRGQLVRLLAGRCVRLAAIGSVLGMAGGIAAGGLLRAQLHGIDPVDVWSIALGALVATTAAIGASVVPVWRAARLDPIVTLRSD